MYENIPFPHRLTFDWRFSTLSQYEFACTAEHIIKKKNLRIWAGGNLTRHFTNPLTAFPLAFKASLPKEKHSRAKSRQLRRLTFIIIYVFVWRTFSCYNNVRSQFTLQYFSSYVSSRLRILKVLSWNKWGLLVRQKGIRCFFVSHWSLSLGSLPGYGWSRVYACQPKPHRGWVVDLILSTLSVKVNVSLLYRRYFQSKASYLSKYLSN